MSGLISKPKSIKAPPVPPPTPIPEVGPEVGEQARRARPRGRRETFLTGDLIPANDDFKKKRLG